jgi:hypothetical protein
MSNLGVVLVVDVANVMGSRPDGWWRDRAGAATRLMAPLAALINTELTLPDPASDEQAAPERGPDEPVPTASVSTVLISRVVAVTEGRARTATAPPQIEVVAAPADGDTSIVAVAEAVVGAGEVPLVVTADRGLRVRLPAPARIAGPKWLLAAC